MAKVAIRDESTLDFHLKCKGMTQEEFHALYDEFKKAGLRPRVRNPDPLEWTMKVVHEMMVTIGPENAKALGVLAAKEGYTWLKEFLKEKWANRKQNEKSAITLFDDRGKELSVLNGKVVKAKKKG